MGTPLDGAHVRLRPLRPDDLEPLFGWYNDPEIVAPFDRFQLDTFDSFAASVGEAPSDPRSLAPRYVIEGIEGARRLGLVGHYRSHPVLETVDIWYILGEPGERGKGYGSEAVRLLVDELFRTEPLERVGATTDRENVASVRLLEKLGFRREGTIRDALFHHGLWHDVHVYGIRRSERPWATGPARAPA